MREMYREEKTNEDGLRLRELTILQLEKIYTSRKGFHKTDKIFTANTPNAIK